MKYTEIDLIEANKIISYLRSIRIYAATILFLSLLYFGFKIYFNTEGTELYLIYCFASVIILGSLSIIIRLNHKTAFIYGVSCVIGGIIYLFSIAYYRRETQVFFTTIGFIIGLLVIREGVRVAFSKYSQQIFSRANQNKVSFLKNILNSIKQSLPNEENVIHCTYTHDEKKRNMKIKFLDDIACFLLSGESKPFFLDRKNVFIVELQKGPDFLNVSIVAYDHDWLEAQIKPDDFKKYQTWKDI